jgi:YegS/Rv2252/BmrU family lipid kinase
VKVRAILNPRAGVRVPGTRETVERGRSGWSDYAVSVTGHAGHGIELARQAVAEGAEVVVAVGGDGTVNEVAQGIIGTRAALGIVPAGSGNGLARALGLPLRPALALAALETASSRAMDVATLDGRLFLNVAGIGFDAVVGHAFHDHGTRGGRRGLLGYVRLSLRELWAYRAPRLSVEIDGAPAIAIAPFVLTFANGPQYGSNAVINPGARLDDGRLEIAVFDDGPLVSTIASAPRLFAGGLTRSRRYHRLPATRAVVTSDEPFAVHVDGDPGPLTRRVEMVLQPRALRVLVPPEVACDPDGPFSAA